MTPKMRRPTIRSAVVTGRRMKSSEMFMSVFPPGLRRPGP